MKNKTLVTRRQLLRMSATAGTGALLAACAAPVAPAATTAPAAPAPTAVPAAPKGGTVQVLIRQEYFPGLQTAIEKELDTYIKSLGYTPDVSAVNPEVFGDFQAKMQAAVAAGNPPDVAYHGTSVAQMYDNDLVADATPIVDELVSKYGGFVPANAASNAQFKGKWWSVPFITTSGAWFVRKDIAQAAGVDITKLDKFEDRLAAAVKMSNPEFGSLSLVLVVLLGTAHLLGHLFARLRQPRVIGEILAGVLLGPSVLAHFAPNSTVSLALAGQAQSNTTSSNQSALGFLFNLGLLLLMFVSGAETKNLFNDQDRRELTWLGLVGTGLPFFIALAVSPWMPRASLMGSANQPTSLLLVIGIAVAVTSIPVISRILRDLGILHTRFARLVLGVAVCEDIFLWAVLALSVSLARDGSVPALVIAIHTAQTLACLMLGLFVMPRVLTMINRAKWNPFIASSPIAYVCLVLLAYSAVAAALDVSLVFAAFLAGFALAKSTDGFQSAFDTVGKTAFALNIARHIIEQRPLTDRR